MRNSPSKLPKKGKNSQKGPSSSASPGSFHFGQSVDELLGKADDHISSYDFSRAKICCQGAIQMDPNNIRALETLACICLELGDIDEAKKILEKAISLQPESGYKKFMSMGQLLDGEHALKFYQNGIQLMQGELERLMQTTDDSTKDKQESLKRDLSTAYCSVAELYLTDCCFDDDAETRCNENIKNAMNIDPQNPEAYQYLASFLITKEEIDEAKKAIETSLSLWMPRFKEMQHPKEDENKENKDEGKIEVVVCPLAYETRIDTSKILMELEKYDDAVDVLETLLEEDDQMVEVWYLIGWANYLKGEDYKSNARHYFKNVLELAGKVGFDDVGILEHVTELLKELPEEDEEENDDANSVPSSSDEDEPMES